MTPNALARGKETFDRFCGLPRPGWQGQPGMGAPNLTDNIWLYGGTEKTIIETITNGRANQMPAGKTPGRRQGAPADRLRVGLSNNKAAAQ